jgi:hypothetical protein
VVETLLSDAKARMSARLQEKRERNETGDRRLNVVDVDGATAEGMGDPLELLSELFGMENLRERLEGLGKRIRVAQREGRDTVGLIGNWIFTGNPCVSVFLNYFDFFSHFLSHISIFRFAADQGKPQLPS